MQSVLKYNYLQSIQGETNGEVYGLQKTRHLTLGSLKLFVAVDHKPLVKVLSDRNLHAIDNHRLENLKEKTLQ